MQHSDAVRTMASEKYLLGELAPEQREEFEEHFFSCSECALDMRAGAALLEHSKLALSAPAQEQDAVSVPAARPGGRNSWWRPAVWGPVMALLLVVVGFESFFTLSKSGKMTAGLTPQILPAASLVSVRGDRVPRIEVGPKQSYLLFVDIPAESRFASYVCELTSPEGAVLWSIPVSSEAAQDTLPLQVPSGHTAPGVYSLVIRGVTPGQNSAILVRYPFELDRK
jgi:Putative zinc-finger